MANVRISRREAEKGLLPRICVLTGEPTDAVKKKSFSWTPGWTKFLILGGLLPYILVSLILMKRMTVRFPMVKNKHGHWLVRTAFLLVGVFFTLQLACGGAYFGSQVDNADLGMVMALTGMMLFLFVLIVGLVLMNRSIRPVEITDYDIRLSGVHENFKDALLAMREERRREKDDRIEPGFLSAPPKARRYDPDGDLNPRAD